MRTLLALALLTLSSCASAPKAPLTIEEVCPDDEACPPAKAGEVREFFKRYGL